MSYTGVGLAFPLARCRTPAYKARVDLLAERRVTVYRVQNQRFARLREVVVGELEAGSDPTRKASRRPLLSSSDTGEIRRINSQPTAQFPEADAPLHQEFWQGFVER